MIALTKEPAPRLPHPALAPPTHLYIWSYLIMTQESQERSHKGGNHARFF
ncbi:hypothetical protein [Crinalium epipsammum]|nr:hypothetical protein [Crinalium epipsammum]